MTYVKHSERSLRHPCKQCGKGGLADKSISLYWGHDTDRPGEDCQKCSVSGKWVLIESDGTMHACHTSGPGEVPGMPAPSVPAPVPSGTPAGNAEVAGKLADLLASLAPTVDMTKIIAEVNQVVNDRMSEVVKTVEQMTMPTIVHVQNEKGEIREMKGYTHSMLPTLIQDLQATDPDGSYLSVLMVGPAGTGKSRLAKQAAEALGIAFGELSLGPQTTKSDILGYKDANGNYHPTMFRQMYETGGLMHFDEFDAVNSAVITLINGGTSNGHMAFPDGLVKRHPDFRLVCSANTYGNGPDRTYVARQKLDGATKDRFVIEDIRYDLALEDALCRGYDLPDDHVTQILTYVRALRASAERQKMPLIFGTRSSVQSCALLASGKPLADVIEARIRSGISDADWSKVTQGVTKPRF